MLTTGNASTTDAYRLRSENTTVVQLLGECSLNALSINERILNMWADAIFFSGFQYAQWAQRVAILTVVTP